MLDPTLLKISELLHTQDNRCTGHPIFCVEQKIRDYGYGPRWEDNPVWVSPDGDECDEGEPEAVETAYRDRWETVTMMFTQESADAFIRQNEHRYHRGLRVYVDSLYRNPEMIYIRNWLLKYGEEAEHGSTDD